MKDYSPKLIAAMELLDEEVQAIHKRAKKAEASCEELFESTSMRGDFIASKGKEMVLEYAAYVVNNMEADEARKELEVFACVHGFDLSSVIKMD